MYTIILYNIVIPDIGVVIKIIIVEIHQWSEYYYKNAIKVQ